MLRFYGEFHLNGYKSNDAHLMSLQIVYFRADFSNAHIQTMLVWNALVKLDKHLKQK